MSDIDYYKTTIEDIDGDPVEVSGDSRDLTVTLTISDGGGFAYESEVTPENARALAAGLMLAASIADGNGLPL